MIKSKAPTNINIFVSNITHTATNASDRSDSPAKPKQPDKPAPAVGLIKSLPCTPGCRTPDRAARPELLGPLALDLLLEDSEALAASRLKSRLGFCGIKFEAAGEAFEFEQGLQIQIQKALWGCQPKSASPAAAWQSADPRLVSELRGYFKG